MPTLKSCMKTSLRRAHRVLESIELGELTKDERDEIVVESYENCREQGYAAVIRGLAGAGDIKIAWAECRGSDEMVAYVGKPNDFGTGNIPNEEVYRGAVYFSSKKGTAFKDRWSEERCAEFIKKMLVPQAKAARAAMEKALANKKSA
jgi:hypothetical protein